MKRELFAFTVIFGCCLVILYGLRSGGQGFYLPILLKNIKYSWLLLNLFRFDLALFYTFWIVFVLFLFRNKLFSRRA